MRAGGWRALSFLLSPLSAQLPDLRLLRDLDDRFVQHRIHEASHGEHSTDDCANLDEEMREALAGLLVSHSHRGKIVPEVQRGHLLIYDLVRVGGELVDVQ